MSSPLCAAALLRRSAPLRPVARAATRAASGSPYARTLDATSIKGRHLDDLFSFTGSEIEALLKISHALKDKMGVRKQVYQPLVRAGWRARGDRVFWRRGPIDE